MTDAYFVSVDYRTKLGSPGRWCGEVRAESMTEAKNMGLAQAAKSSRRFMHTITETSAVVLRA